MNVHSVIPFLSFFAYLALAVVIVGWGRTRATRWFCGIVACEAVWSGSSFLLRSGIAADNSYFWVRLLFVASLAFAVGYYRFARAFQNRKPDILVYAGYFVLILGTVLSVLGEFPRSVRVDHGVLVLDRGPFFYPLFAAGFSFLMLTLLTLYNQYRVLRDPVARTRTLYVLIATSFVVGFGLINVDEELGNLSVDHIGNIFNASVVAYAILKHRLLEIKLVVRRTLAIAAVTVLLAAVYFMLVANLGEMLETKYGVPQRLVLGLVMIVGAGVFGLLKNRAQAFVDRAFLGDSYTHQQKLLHLHDEAEGALDVESVARSMLNLLVRSVQAVHGALLLPVRGVLVTQCTVRDESSEPLGVLKLQPDNPLVAYLERSRRPALARELDLVPELKGLWRSEMRDLDAVGCEVLCPLMSGEKLAGILALGEKKKGGHYSEEDMELLAVASGDAAALVESASRHSAVQAQANTDGLTGLLNHRFFYQNLEEQIRRSSRFGSSFSLMMLDLDLFKAYNDTHGHMAGDAILRDVAACLLDCVRRIDVAFRYGGEEFAVILPEATSLDAFKVAERVRRTVEARMDARDVWLTISIGVSSWPKDGVTAGEVVQRADAALYQAKRAGRNCTRSYTDGPISIAGVGGQPAWMEDGLSTVYALAAAVDAKDHYTYGHSRKVGKYTTATAEAMGLSDAEVVLLRDSGLLHDIGKISVPDAVLRKPGRLNDQEWQQMRGHPEVAVAILKHVERLSVCLPVILHHHERFDGSGYPLGLAGNDIPLGARIIAVADSYDAMTSDRPYRRALLPEEALNELLMCAGRQFDPEIVRAFTRIVEPSWTRPARVPSIAPSA